MSPHAGSRSRHRRHDALAGSARPLRGIVVVRFSRRFATSPCAQSFRPSLTVGQDFRLPDEPDGRARAACGW